MHRSASCFTLPLLLFLGWAVPVAAQPEQGAQAAATLQQLDANPTLFAVLAAINTAGYDADITSPSNHPARRALRDFLAKQNLKSVDALKQFYEDHRVGNGAAQLNQYVSFALLSAGAPDFGPADPDLQAPPDAASVAELAPLLADFYEEANISTLFSQALPYYLKMLDSYAEPVSNEVLQINAYLREPLRHSDNRSFHVFVELLAAPNQVITRNYLDDYYVVVTPSKELRIEEIRHTFLHYMVDRWGVRHADILRRFANLGDYALESPILEDQYRVDFNLLATECLIKALEARITKEPERVDQAMREGFVLTAAFYDKLTDYEQQQLTMEYYLPDMLKSIDLAAETPRIAKTEFATSREYRTVQVTRVVGPPPLTGVAKTLEQGENAIRARDAKAAKEIFDDVFEESDEPKDQARAYYGLARVAILDNDPETADGLFRRVVDMAADDATRSWSFLYLGKLADSQGRLDQAKEFYRQALEVAGAPDQVRGEAQQGLDGAFARPRPPQ